MTSGTERAEALLREMVEIPSPSGEEAGVVGYLADVLPEWGFQSSVDEVGNVIGRRGDPAAPMILLLGHIDTVPGRLPVRREGRLLHGRGSIDAKGPFATMICAASALECRDVQIVVAGAVEEETFGRGARHVAQTFSPDAAIVGEPNGWSGIGIGYKGRTMLRYEVSRPAAHTASGAENASEAAAAFWHRLTGHLAGFPSAERVFDRPVATLCDIEGGLEHARLTVSCRTPPGFDLPAFERFLAAAGDGDLIIDDRTPAMVVDHRGAAVRALSAGIRAQGGRPRLKLKTGTADLNIVGQYWQVPMAVYGPGDSALDHTDHEHIDLDEYASAITVLGDALQRLAGELATTSTLVHG